VGTHANLEEFLDKGRDGMASTFLTACGWAAKLIDAKGRLPALTAVDQQCAAAVAAASPPLITLAVVFHRRHRPGGPSPRHWVRAGRSRVLVHGLV